MNVGNISEYESQHSYIGAALGRVTERIKDAKFEIDGVEFKVSANDNNIHQVHGGTSGFDTVFKTRPIFKSNYINHSQNLFSPLLSVYINVFVGFCRFLIPFCVNIFFRAENVKITYVDAVKSQRFCLFLIIRTFFRKCLRLQSTVILLWWNTSVLTARKAFLGKLRRSSPSGWRRKTN